MMTISFCCISLDMVHDEGSVARQKKLAASQATSPLVQLTYISC
jgi:hypothetical protein